MYASQCYIHYSNDMYSNVGGSHAWCHQSGVQTLCQFASRQWFLPTLPLNISDIATIAITDPQVGPIIMILGDDSYISAMQGHLENENEPRKTLSDSVKSVYKSPWQSLHVLF